MLNVHETSREIYKKNPTYLFEFLCDMLMYVIEAMEVKRVRKLILVDIND